MRKFVAVIIALCFSVTLFVPVNATEAASELTALCEIVADGKADNRLTDNSIYTYLEVNELNISCEEKIYGVYIKFDREPEQWKLLSNGTETLE
ncbi:MAG: hypothetical protein IJA27_05695, partial [Lachnospiraceae bacterium]|nr:hypothetical protein [Lachnospiraceae bacterium]